MSINHSYFDRQVTENLKGILALAVLLHHIYQKTDIISHDSLLGFFCQSVGYYCVSSFFFISGYGLLCSYNRNKEQYLADFQKNRVLPIFTINALLVLIYACQKFFLGFELSPSEILLSFIYGGNVVTNGWYLLCIILFYELFYFATKLTPYKVSLTTLALILGYVIIAFRMPVWYIVSSLAFPCGMLFREHKDRIDYLLEKHIVAISFALLSTYITCFSFLFLINVNDFSGITGIGALQFFISMIHGVLFCCVLVLVLVWKSNWLQQDNFIIRNLSLMYLELYVMQGLAFNFLRNPSWSVDNDYTFSICSIILTITFAATIHPVFLRIIKSIRK